MKLSITHAFFLAAVSILAMVVGIIYQPAQQASAAGPFATNIGSATSSALVSVTTSTRIAATTTSPTDPTNNFQRVYTTICVSTSTPVAILMNLDKPVNASTGGVTAWIAVAPGYSSCYEINDRNQYNSSITASSTNQLSIPVSVTQYVQ